MHRCEPDILVIEDNDEDYFMIQRAFTKNNISNISHRCKDGNEALNFLFRKENYADPKSSPRPCIILLDLNLPGTHGQEVLSEIKKDTELRKTPVIVLTTSSDPKDINTCYALGANSYINKSVDLKRFVQTIDIWGKFWLDAVLLPKYN